MFFQVREHIPLEQGLRLIIHIVVALNQGQRAYSIRTRIKTVISLIFSFNVFIVREHIPLEQGLRLKIVEDGAYNLVTSESIFH